MAEAATPRLGPWRIAGLALVFVWFFVGGIGHFLISRVFVGVVPDYVPLHQEVVWFTGACEIAGALALLYRPLRRIAGWCLTALTVCVTPVHIDMLQHADRYRSLGEAALWGRLLFQPVFIAIVWWATRPPRA